MAHYTKLEDGSYACSCGGSTTLRFRGSTFLGCDACLSTNPDPVASTTPALHFTSTFLEAIAKDSKVASSAEVRELALEILERRRVVSALEGKIERLEGDARTWQVRAETVERALNAREERMIAARDERAKRDAAERHDAILRCELLEKVLKERDADLEKAKADIEALHQRERANMQALFNSQSKLLSEFENVANLRKQLYTLEHEHHELRALKATEQASPAISKEDLVRARTDGELEGLAAALRYCGLHAASPTQNDASKLDNLIHHLREVYMLRKTGDKSVHLFDDRETVMLEQAITSVKRETWDLALNSVLRAVQAKLEKTSEPMFREGLVNAIHSVQVLLMGGLPKPSMKMPWD